MSDPCKEAGMEDRVLGENLPPGGSADTEADANRRQWEREFEEAERLRSFEAEVVRERNASMVEELDAWLAEVVGLSTAGREEEVVLDGQESRGIAGLRLSEQVEVTNRLHAFCSQWSITPKEAYQCMQDINPDHLHALAWKSANRRIMEDVTTAEQEIQTATNMAECIKAMFTSLRQVREELHGIDNLTWQTGHHSFTITDELQAYDFVVDCLKPNMDSGRPLHVICGLGRRETDDSIPIQCIPGNGPSSESVARVYSYLNPLRLEKLLSLLMRIRDVDVQAAIGEALLLTPEENAWIDQAQAYEESGGTLPKTTQAPENEV